MRHQHSIAHIQRKISRLLNRVRWRALPISIDLGPRGLITSED